MPAESLEETLNDLKNDTQGVREAAILSTCNRVEIYCAVDEANHANVENWFCQHRSVSIEEIQPAAYLHWDQDAARHMMRVAAGLDSQVLGEPQIMGQLKTAYQVAQQAGTLGAELNLLCQFTLNTAKKVRTDTDIGKNPVSVAYASVALAKQIFSDFENKHALLIGAGETIDLVAQHLKKQGVKHLSIANRTLAHAEILADKFDGQALSLEQIPEQLSTFDIVISSTGSPGVLLNRSTVQNAIQQRKHKPMFMVDIAVPRDIDPEVDGLRDVFLYSIDDLTEVIEENISNRQRAAEEAELIIQAGAVQFLQQRSIRDSQKLLTAFRSSAEAVQKTALSQALKRVEKGEDPVQVIEQLARTLTNKLIHHPTLAIRHASANGEVQVIETIRKLYNLDDSHFPDITPENESSTGQ